LKDPELAGNRTWRRVEKREYNGDKYKEKGNNGKSGF